MKIKFEVEYDTETKLFNVESGDASLPHSGSSYLRIIPKGQANQIGQVFCCNPWWDEEKVGEKSKQRYLCLGIDEGFE